MTTPQSILFGCLQGITEFLPVSSSGHLALLKNLVGLEEIPRLFDVLLHLATLFVILIIFRRKILDILAALSRFLRGRRTETDTPLLRLVTAIIIATFCTGTLGILLKDLNFESRPRIVAVFLIVTALILVAGRLFEKRRGAALPPSQPGIRAGIITGIAQGIGVLPGISRSGITISAALFAGVGRAEAGEFSFLLSIPAILGALVLSLNDMGNLAQSVPLPALAAGIASAMISGYICLRLLMRVIRGGRLHLFALYLVPAGILGIILL